ncbi:LacI family DNA-binding transcriptional regulator [Cellulomonas sp. JZ18]|uniref:LacI family DNA-binding transcriptional regulator n=1 Tax=Cellulomonas sp. JZ18 TaxID=2654191 RepID=UPI0012D41280|nr:LacI family DNA-binding transcriptional regulator [Cellulomonas sp. JZ18]QGQ18827.1 LacI family DNA-binding transcriptional regulator [Cellulomonas sp. JZ18]
MSERRVTSRDVARRAGVSQSTVSYVLNRTPGQSISEATRERVLQAAEELGYTPSAAARALRSGTTGVVVGVLADAPLGAVVVQVLEAFGQAVEAQGYSVMFQRRRGRSLDEILQALTPVGVAQFAAFSADELAPARQRGIPVVGVSIDGTNGNVVRIPQHRVGEIQAAHLVERGHTRLGYAASADPLAVLLLRGRLAGVREVCAAHGLPEPVVVDVPLYPDAAARAVRRLRNREEPVTAAVAYDDEVALALLAGAHAVGVRVPEDLAVVGVDDVPMARLAQPPITTVRVHTDDTGTGLARHLLRQLDPGLGLPEPDDEPSIDLVARAST